MDFLRTILPLYGDPAPEGCSEEEIAMVKERFGAIPRVVEDFYRAAAKTDAFHHAQDNWVLPQKYREWTWLHKTDALILLVENQGVCFAGILREDLVKPDPPVYVSYGRDEKDWNLCARNAGDWQLCAGSTTDFLAAALAYESAFTFEFAPDAFYWYTPEEQKTIQERMTGLPFRLENWCSEMKITFCQNAPDNLLVLMSFQGEEEAQALYGAATGESYQRLIALVGRMGEEI